MIVSNQRDRLFALGLKRAITATFDYEKWTELSYLTGAEYILKHPRLLRSLGFGDPDYPDCVFQIVDLLCQDTRNIPIIDNYVNPKEWLKENDPELYKQIYIEDHLPMDTINSSADILDVAELNKHADRIRKSIDTDPELAIGSTKELLETVFKALLGRHGDNLTRENLPALWTAVRKLLDLNPIDNKMLGYDLYKKILGSLNQLVDSICEIRGIHGTGHGRAKATPPDKNEAKLVVNAGITLATYVLEKHLNNKKTF